MIPSSFTYQKATSVEEAVKILQHNHDAKLIAGGHSLLPSMKLRLSAPESLVDIRELEALRGISRRNPKVVIGAATTHAEVAASGLLSDAFEMLPLAAGQIGDPQVRNIGTIGGNIAHADPASDWPALLLACGAEIEVQGPSGKRLIPADDFFKGLFSTALGQDEVILAVHVPIPKSEVCSTYQKFSQPASRYAIVGCAAAVQKEDGIVREVHVAFNGVAAAAFRDKGVEDAIRGTELMSSTIDAASELAAEKVDALSDQYASPAYRKHLAKVLAKRALHAICH